MEGKWVRSRSPGYGVPIELSIHVIRWLGAYLGIRHGHGHEQKGLTHHCCCIRDCKGPEDGDGGEAMYHLDSLDHLRQRDLYSSRRSLVTSSLVGGSSSRPIGLHRLRAV